jgi:hypothetical protein
MAPSLTGEHKIPTCLCTVLWGTEVAGDSCLAPVPLPPKTFFYICFEFI